MTNVLALLVAIVATAVSVLAAVRLEQALRLGVEFHFHRSGMLRVIDSKSATRGGVLQVKPRGPGKLYDVSVTAWPPSRIDYLDADGKPMSPGALKGAGRRTLTADDEPIELPYRLNVDRKGKLPEPIWVGMVWEQPGFRGGFVPGGWRVRVEGTEKDRDQRWSRLLKRWVPYLRRGKEPKKHPVYGSILQPEPPRERKA